MKSETHLLNREEQIMIRINEYPVLNYIYPRHILVSTFLKDKLDVLVDGVLSANPGAMFYSTGGTGKRLKGIMGLKAETNYMSVEDFTGCPEMEGGLVKTLHPKIHAGLLAERYNPYHEKVFKEEMVKFGRGPGVYFDVFAGNLYPFNDVVRRCGGSVEIVRCNIDIGGPAMTMAAAKNWHSVTVLSDPSMYGILCKLLIENNGCIPAASRFRFAVMAMGAIAKFRADNYHSFYDLDFEKDVLPTINLV